MAKRQIETLTDDIDGTDAAGTLSFAVDGVHYEIELSEKNRAKFDKAIAPFLDAGRRVRSNGSAAPRRGGSAPGRRTDLSGVRTWAREQSWEVSERGRIAAEITEAYDAAH